MARRPVRTADAAETGGYGRGVATMSHQLPLQREAQERLWRALTRLDAIDQPGAEPNAERDQVELEVMEAWTEYERSRSEPAQG